MLGECDLAAGATEVVLTYLLPVYVVVRNEGGGAYVEKVVVDDEASFDEWVPAQGPQRQRRHPRPGAAGGRRGDCAGRAVAP